ncbi:TetR-like C-terminal domain-containing protein [Streptosporangium sp. NPDC000396]|uniref:TetR-like C-terminal domain-containing protein n=1 Tax=Streptosporangium sp. NPDC000396 TaxID=3366185 RepID=UPI0036A4FA04
MSIKTRRERERAQPRQLIITAARELAEAEGWDAVTTRRLADTYLNFAVTRPALYEAMFVMPIDVTFGGTSETPAPLKEAFGGLDLLIDHLIGDPSQVGRS